MEPDEKGKYRSTFEIEGRKGFDALQEDQEHHKNQIEKDWYSLEHLLKGVIEQLLPKKGKVANQRWITEEILENIEERRKVEANNERILTIIWGNKKRT